jgi:hypothetical protein
MGKSPPGANMLVGPPISRARIPWRAKRYSLTNLNRRVHIRRMSRRPRRPTRRLSVSLNSIVLEPARVESFTGPRGHNSNRSGRSTAFVQTSFAGISTIGATFSQSASVVSRHQRPYCTCDNPQSASPSILCGSRKHTIAARECQNDANAILMRRDGVLPPPPGNN